MSAAPTLPPDYGRPGALRAAPPPPPHRRWPRLVGWIAAGLLVVVVLGAVGWALSHQTSATPRQVPAVRNDIPSPLRSELREFVNQVGAR